MNEGITEEKMNRIDDYKYHVVEFLNHPLKDKERDSGNHICVPRSWAKWCSPKENLVKIWYPPRDSCNIEEQVENRGNKSELWESFYCRLRYSADSYATAKRKILEYNTRSIEAENLLTSPQLATISAKNDFLTNVLELTSIPKLHESANSKAQKRKAPDGGGKAHSKISKVTEPNEIGEEVAGLSEQPFELINEYQSLTHALPVEETQEASVEKTKIHHTNTEDQPTVNASEPNHSFEDMSRNSLSESNIPAQTEQSKSLIPLMSTLQEQLKKIYPILMETKSTNNNLETAMASLSAKIEQLEAQKTKEKNYIALLEGIIEDLQKSSNV